MKRGGWSLLELLVALGLAGVSLLIISQLLGATLRAAHLELGRNTAHSQLTLALRELESALQRSCLAGVAWQEGPPAILAVHPQSSGALAHGLTWEPFWLCFYGDSATHTLRLRQAPPFGPGPPPSTSKPQVPLDLAVLGSDPVRASRPLLTGLKTFTYRGLPGTLVEVALETEVTVPGRQAAETFRALRQFHLRNHNR